MPAARAHETGEQAPRVRIGGRLCLSAESDRWSVLRAQRFWISLNGSLDGSAGCTAEILRRHGGPYADGGVEGEEPGLGNGGELRGILHVEEYVTAAGTIGLSEVSGFGFEVGEDLLDKWSELAGSNGGIRGFRLA